MRSGKFDAAQAAGIRAAVRPAPVQVIAVTGGKGGVGKTSVAVNLAAALAAQGKRVLLFDGDMGLANVDVLLGLTPRFTLEHVLDCRCTLEEAVIESPLGFHIVKVEDKRGAGVKPVAVVRQEIKEMIEEEKLEKKFDEWISSIRAKSHIEIKW